MSRFNIPNPYYTPPSPVPAAPTFADPRDDFHSFAYLRHTFRVMEHLASLNLDLRNRRILEISAGIGDLTTFFLDRGCTITATDVRPENLRLMQSRFAAERAVTINQLNLDPPPPPSNERFDAVFFFGVLYHLSTPAEAIAYLAPMATDLFLLESCVSLGTHEAINPVAEPAHVPSQAASGGGCRPTRPWIFSELKKHFPYVYMPTTQPNFANFITDWTIPTPTTPYTRAIFIGSRKPLSNPLLVDHVPMTQTRH
jgi:hypothetical protein